MTASFHTPMSFKGRAIIVIALLSLAFWNFPETGKVYAEAQEPQKSSLVFEIKPLKDLTKIKTKESEQNKVNKERIATAKKAALLKEYLENKNSPFADHAQFFVEQPEWKKIVSISASESSLGQRCYVNNCSGIFGKNGLRTYDTLNDWITDMQGLLDKRYKNMSLHQMNGIYVVPRSANWLAASSKVYTELTELEQESIQEFPEELTAKQELAQAL